MRCSVRVLFGMRLICSPVGERKPMENSSGSWDHSSRVKPVSPSATRSSASSNSSSVPMVPKKWWLYPVSLPAAVTVIMPGKLLMVSRYWARGEVPSWLPRFVPRASRIVRGSLFVLARDSRYFIPIMISFS